MGCPHTSFKKGAPIFLQKRDGECLKCKFVSKSSAYITINVDGRDVRVFKRDIRACDYYRGVER